MPEAFGACLQASALSAPHALRHETVLGRTVKRLAFCAHCFASAGFPFALLHEAHLSGAVKRLAVCAHRMAVTRLRCGRADREAGNHRRYDNALHQIILHLRRVGPPCGQPEDFDRDRMVSQKG
jgi:hypothetical protein